MRLQTIELGEASLHKQFPFSAHDGAYRNGRQPDVAAHKPIWTAKQSPAEKNGTLTLNQAAYSLPDNDLPGIIPLHLNENLFAASTTAVNKRQLVKLFTTHLENLHTYPINGMKHLQTAIANGLHIQPDKIVLSPGSSALLRQMVFYLLKKNEMMLVPAPSWSFYRAMADLVSAKIDTFPLLDVGNAFVYDKNLIATKIEACHPKVVLICSPNNPTGNVMPIEDFLWLVHEYPHVDFILDEAYYGFHESYSATQEKALLDSTDNRNLFVIRTFSKFYGLANLRIGFLICSKADAQNLQKIAPVFGLPSLNQALAAHRLADKYYQSQVQQEYAAVNAYMVTALRQIPGFTPYKTCSNFILVRHDSRWSALEDKLLDHGYKIKRETINGARNYLRITFADMMTMEKLVAVIRQLAYRNTAVTSPSIYTS